eukprot:3574408-Rhodomonas_salina.2
MASTKSGSTVYMEQVRQGRGPTSGCDHLSQPQEDPYAPARRHPTNSAVSAYAPDTRYPSIRWYVAARVCVALGALGGTAYAAAVPCDGRYCAGVCAPNVQSHVRSWARACPAHALLSAAHLTPAPLVLGPVCAATTVRG